MIASQAVGTLSSTITMPSNRVRRLLKISAARGRSSRRCSILTMRRCSGGRADGLVRRLLLVLETEVIDRAHALWLGGVDAVDLGGNLCSARAFCALSRL